MRTISFKPSNSKFPKPSKTTEKDYSSIKYPITSTLHKIKFNIAKIHSAMLSLTIMKANKEGLAKSIQNRFCKFQRVGKYINALLNRIANLIA